MRLLHIDLLHRSVDSPIIVGPKLFFAAAFLCYTLNCPASYNSGQSSLGVGIGIVLLFYGMVFMLIVATIGAVIAAAIDMGMKSSPARFQWACALGGATPSALTMLLAPGIYFGDSMLWVVVLVAVPLSALYGYGVGKLIMFIRARNKRL